MPFQSFYPFAICFLNLSINYKYITLGTLPRNPNNLAWPLHHLHQATTAGGLPGGKAE
ncbi:hypothetical protein BX600DRAFT_472099 [Xylariales sp. PMI_506]|nr:hypothetical protein BX600DRAFT_472099 [Xylariales sp. PMI_506]